MKTVLVDCIFKVCDSMSYKVLDALVDFTEAVYYKYHIYFGFF